MWHLPSQQCAPLDLTSLRHQRDVHTEPPDGTLVPTSRLAGHLITCTRPLQRQDSPADFNIRRLDPLTCGMRAAATAASIGSRAPQRQLMRTRPASITVIAWILILLGGISLVTTALMIDKIMIDNPAARELISKSPIPVPVQYAMTYVGLLIMLVTGVAMLKGQNWGRWLYVVGTTVGFLIGIITSPLKEAMIPGFVFFVVVSFFLFRPKANKYFSDTESAHDTQSA
jgi:hypothetical protein